MILEIGSNLAKVLIVWGGLGAVALVANSFFGMLAAAAVIKRDK